MTTHPTINKILLVLFILLQLAFTFLHEHYGFVSNLSFALISAIIFSASILFSPLQNLLPVYAHFEKILESEKLKWKLKIVYSVMAFSYCTLGGIVYLFFKWMAQIVITLMQAISQTSTYEAPNKIIEIAWNAYFSPENRLLLLLVGICVIIAHLTFSISRRYGTLFQVHKTYSNHHLKFSLFRQESRLEILSMGVGATLNFYFSVLFLLLSLVRGFKLFTFDNWVRNRASAQQVSENSFDNTAFNLYKHIFIFSFFWLPFFDKDVLGQIEFVCLICFPLVFAIILSIFYHTSKVNNTYFEIMLKVVFSISYIMVGILQFNNLDAHPLLHKLLEAFQFMKERVYLEFGSFFFKTLYLVVFLYYASAVWLIDSEEYRLKFDPMGSYFAHKLNYFIFSVILRVACVILFFHFTKVQDFIPFLNMAPIIIAITSVMITDNDESESFLKDIKASHSQKAFSESLNRRKVSIEKLLNSRNLLNLIYLIILNIVIIFMKDPFYIIVSFGSTVFVVFLYYIKMNLEVLSARKFLDVELNIIGFSEGFANSMSLGHYRNKKGIK